METCANCGRSIGNLEQQSVWQNKIVCAECNDRLTKQFASSSQAHPDQKAVQADDAIVFEDHPCMFRARPFSFILCIILIPVGIGLIILLVWWLKCRTATLTITRKRLVYRTGVLSKSTDEIWHNDVRNVVVRQSFLQRMFGCGDIAVSTAGQSGIEVSAQGFKNPQQIADYIRQFRNV